MKLFQRLLVAPAALGLMAPVAVNADTAFSSTTTLSGSAVFTLGSVDSGTAANPADDEMIMVYGYSLDMNSSFTGEDSLYVGLEAGNNTSFDDGGTSTLSIMDSAVGNGSTLQVHSAYYSFPVGDLSITAGPLLDQDDVISATTSAYSDAFVLGSAPWSLSGEGGAPGIAVSYAGDSGLNASVSYVGLGGTNSTQGLNSDAATDITTISVGYDGDGFGGGLVLTSADDDVPADGHDSFGVGIYYTPESIPATISVAYDTTDPSATGAADATDLFIGVDYEVGPGTLSTAYFNREVDDDDDKTDQTGFELSYSYPVNDYVTTTAGFFSVEEDTTEEDDTGVVFETVFSF